MAQKTVKIGDVARAAGVSTATVSRALSDPEKVTDSTRDSVLKAIRETGYRPNRAASSLRRQTSRAVLVLVPNLGNPFFSQILAAISATLSESGYSVLISDSSRAPGRSHVDYFLDSRIDGMISLDGGLTQGDIEVFRSAGVADRIVCACEWIDGAALPSIRSDNAAGAALAVNHLHELGHQRIAHVSGPEDNVLTGVRRRGMLEGATGLGLEVPDAWVLPGGFSLEDGERAALRFVQMEERPTAVFCASDMVAFGLIAGLMQAGIRVPDDISVVGFDDIELAEYYVPALTTIRQHRHALGVRAARTLLEMLGGDQPRAPSVELIGVELAARDSTAPPPT